MVYAGTIVEINNNKTYVMTMDYSIITIRTKKEYLLGQQITFKKHDISRSIIQINKNIKILGLVASFVFLIVATSFTSSLLRNPRKVTFDDVCTALVSVDINPSIEININKAEQIVSVYAKNEDGIKLLNNLDLSHKALADGVNEIVATAMEMGYINDSKKMILVSAALYNSSQEDTSTDYALQLQQILTSLEAGQDSADLLTVYIDDSAIIDEAKTNNLSIGKELLYQYAQSQDQTLTADSIRSASLNELLDNLNAISQDGNLVDSLQHSELVLADNESTPAPTTAPIVQSTPTPSIAPSETPIQTVTPTPTVTPTELPLPSLTVTPSPTAIPEPSRTPTSTPTPTKEPAITSFSPKLKLTTNDSTIKFDWTGLSSSNVTYKEKEYYGFHYYKVVASKTNDRPIYPDDGYLTYISDYSDSNWSVTPSEGNYNHSPELTPGDTYYVSITYVFENGKFTSDTKTVTIPVCEEADCDEPTFEETDCDELSSLDLSIRSKENSLIFNWTPVDSSCTSYNEKNYKGFHYYKVVASKTNSSPKYPEDGYLTYITDTNTSSWSLTPSSDDYNLNPMLESGETYYFSITYVFENGKVYSNTVKHKVP